MQKGLRSELYLAYQKTTKGREMTIEQNNILSYLAVLKPELEKVGVTKLGLFGSYAKGNTHHNSDIDIVYEIDFNRFKNTIGGGFKYLVFFDKLQQQIQQQFNTDVDLCDASTMPLDKKETLLQGAIYV